MNYNVRKPTQNREAGEKEKDPSVTRTCTTLLFSVEHYIHDIMPIRTGHNKRKKEKEIQSEIYNI